MADFKKIKRTIIEKKLGYRKPKIDENSSKGEQFTLTLPIEIIRDMDITEIERGVVLIYNPISKEIKIKKKIEEEIWKQK